LGRVFDLATVVALVMVAVRPLETLVILAAIGLSVLGFLFVFSPAAKYASNRCCNCGYALRASPKRCPECGEPVIGHTPLHPRLHGRLDHRI